MTKSTEVDDLKARLNRITRDKEEAEYCLEEAELEIERLKDRLGDQPRKGRPQSPDKMPKRHAEPEYEHKIESDDSKRPRKEGSIDRRGPSRTPIHRQESNTQNARRESGNYEALQKEIADLKKKCEILLDENKSLSDFRTNATATLDKARDEAARYKKQMETSDATIHKFHQEIDKLKSQCQELDRSMKTERQQREEIQRSLQQSKVKEKDLYDQLDRLQQVLSAERRAKEEALVSVRHSQSKEENLRDTIDRLQRNISSEREAKDEALLRLSAVAGNKLRDNNPGITDLSDPNRPMKLAEKVSELYDNEWTNAMENLERYMDEEKAIKVLLDIITNVFETFEEAGDAQTNFISSLELPVAVPDIDNLQSTARSSLLNNGKLTALPTEITKPLKDYRKSHCETVSPLLTEVMKSRLQTVYQIDGKIIEACKEYIEYSVKYVWMMRVQDPPVHIEWEFSHGEKFDHDRLRSYTKGGDSLNYVVWPILYLYKGGPMLAKGVAQGMKKKPE
ncbi:myosin-2 heavy chain-like [Ylistrum balloti]|uniref:myosin-2 heavy chain-like n=1 Tax=Ylistrum balloti TaxID=509963 RepID=UPI002905BED6|nr:myosin-2 heavy chain-like [Ylistrum balloti]